MSAQWHTAATEVIAKMACGTDRLVYGIVQSVTAALLAMIACLFSMQIATICTAVCYAAIITDSVLSMSYAAYKRWCCHRLLSARICCASTPNRQ
jgi:hypothetical protein